MTTTDMHSEQVPQRFYSLFVTGFALTGLFFTSVNMRYFGSSWLFWFLILPMSGLCVVRPRVIPLMQPLVTITALLGGIRTISVWADAGRLLAFTVPALWVIALASVVSAVQTARRAIGLPWLPSGEQPGRSQLLWVTVVFRPVALFALSLGLFVSALAYHWSGRVGFCGGFTLSGLITMACLISLASLLYSLMELRGPTDRPERPSAKGASLTTRVAIIAFLVVFTMGVSIEWRGTGSYFLFSILALTLLCAVLILLRLKAFGSPDAASALKPAEWPPLGLVVVGLFILLYSLAYIELVGCVF